MKPSAESRAAGGRKWHATKGTENSVKWDGPESYERVCRRQENMDITDEYIVTKGTVREQLSEGYNEDLVTVIPEGKKAPRNKKTKKASKGFKDWSEE